MKLDPFIKPKSGFWQYIPWLSTFTANAIYPNIYLPQQVYDDLLKENPEPKNVSVLIHEQTHLKRQKEMGWLIFGLKYLFFPKFRFNEELIAIKESMKYLKKKNITCDTERRARFLSSWIYLWPVSYEYAKEELDKAWESV